jgi:hypothetical protein
VMPRSSQKKYRVVRDWTFVPSRNVVQTFKVGTIAQGLTRRCVEAGIAANALQPLTARKRSLSNGKTHHL